MSRCGARFRPSDISVGDGCSGTFRERGVDSDQHYFDWFMEDLTRIRYSQMCASPGFFRFL
jgi:hypothetical protein